MKVGDLIKVKDDPTNICGIGILYDKDGSHLVKVHWFDESLNDRQDEWIQIHNLEDASEKDT